MNHTGGCHCGTIKYQVEGNVGNVIECNCTICRQNGYLLWFVAKENFTLLTEDSHSRSYTFGEKTINHNFCHVCGGTPYCCGNDHNGNAMVGINVRSLDDIDLSKIDTKPYDGLSM